MNIKGGKGEGGCKDRGKVKSQEGVKREFGVFDYILYKFGIW